MIERALAAVRKIGERKMKTREQRFALRVALYVLKKNKFADPTKRHVLNFVRDKGFLQFPDTDLQKRWLTDSDEIWENDVCWRRKDLYMDGEIDSPEIGRWRLTDVGVRKVEGSKPKWLKLSDEENQKKFLSAFDYFTPELVVWLLKIARDEDLSVRKKPI